MNIIFDKRKKYILEDDYVQLRPLEVSDFEILKAFGVDEPELWKYTLQDAGSEEGMKQYIETALTRQEKGTAYTFIVFDKKK